MPRALNRSRVHLRTQRAQQEILHGQLPKAKAIGLALAHRGQGFGGY